MKKIFLLGLLFIFIKIHAQQQTIYIWNGKIPGAIETEGYVEKPHIENGRLHSTSQVTQPTLEIFLAEENPTRTGIIIFPGGGYTHLAIEKEGYKIAEWLNALGVHAFVLKYRMPSDKSMTNKTVGPLQDAQRAMCLLRRNAEEYNLNPDKIGIIGFSAGGHLASTLSTHYNQKTYAATDATSAKPNFSILIYPVISMEDGVTHQGSKISLLGENASTELIEKNSNETQVTEETPITFLVHATNDQAVPVENSINYYLALKEHGINAEMHLYEDGGHGFGLGREGTHTQWPDALKNWLRVHQFIQLK